MPAPSIFLNPQPVKVRRIFLDVDANTEAWYRGLTMAALFERCHIDWPGVREIAQRIYDDRLNNPEK
jgi:hypothetical protein